MTDFIKIGKISGVFGIRGEVKFFHFSGERERLAGIEELYLRPPRDAANNEPPGPTRDAAHSGKTGTMREDCGREVSATTDEVPADSVRFEILSLRYDGKTPVAALAGVTNRNAAEQLVGSELFVRKENLAPLDEDSYFVEDLIGMSVTDTGGSRLGTVTNVISNPAHDILTVKAEVQRGDEDYAGDPDNAVAVSKEFLVPLVDVFVTGIDTFRRIITVDLPEGLM